VTGWSWLALVGLGAFHGLNPAMGWLFAVALGLHRHRRATVFQSLIPIAVGHALAIGAVAVIVVALDLTVDQRTLRIIGGLALIAWAVYHHLYGRRHRVRVGMRAGAVALALWSFLMATAHGAGLMLVPFLVPHDVHPHPAGAAAHHSAGHSLSLALAAIGVHTLAMLAVAGAIALVVYQWVGLGFLRRGWINLDRLWTAALVITGVLLLAGG
jgi:hypothetical protein